MQLFGRMRARVVRKRFERCDVSFLDPQIGEFCIRHDGSLLWSRAERVTRNAPVPPD